MEKACADGAARPAEHHGAAGENALACADEAAGASGDGAVRRGAERAGAGEAGGCGGVL